MCASIRGGNGGILPWLYDHSNPPRLARGETVSGGQFDWGGRLLKSNGGAQRFPQNGWKSFAECKGTRELDCETDKLSRTKVGLSDPVVPHGRAIAQRIKATRG